MPVNRLLLTCLIALYALVVLQNAWLHEDAFITYRSIDNLINGYGPTWNITERVQTFTHPLWFFVIAAAHALTGEVYYTSVITCWVLAVGAAFVMARYIAPTVGNACLGIALLCASKAYIDYSTSGLENPLSHFLLSFFVAVYLRPRFTFPTLAVLSFIAGLATLNRMDTVLLYLPALTTSCWRLRGPRAYRAIAVGFMPFAIWELFSICYYGFLFPNTAYGKLNTGLPSLDMAQQGLHYLNNSLQVDPLTLIAITGCTIGLCFEKKWPQLPLAIGSALYIAYVVKIGGDYMSGRFLSTPFFGSVLLIVHTIATRKQLYAALITVLIFGLAAPFAPIRSDSNYRGAPGDHDIVDERASYYTSTGLLPALMADSTFPQHEWVNLGRKIAKEYRTGVSAVTTYTNLGILGFYAGPHIHHLDPLGITDPLLSRLPAHGDWAPGHYPRIMPDGYIETYLYGYNLIADKKLAAYYDKLCTVISGPLWTTERWLTIWQLNTGHWDHLIEYAVYHRPSDDEQQRSRRRLFPPIRTKPDAPVRAIEAGNLYFARRQFTLALAAYQNAVQLEPENPFSHHNIGVVLLAMDDKQQALIAFQRAAELGSNIAETYRALIWIYKNTGDEEAVQRTYDLAAIYIEDTELTAAPNEP